MAEGFLTGDARDAAVARLASGLLPIMRIEGEDVHYLMDDRLAHYGCPGVSVAVIEHGELSWAEGFGRIETGGPRADAETLFAAASASKPVTAIIAAQLVQEGRIELDGDVNRWLQTWRLPENDFTRQAPVTLRWLLSHKAGTTVHGFGGIPPGPVPSLLDILEGRPPALNGPVRVDKLPGGVNRYSGGGTMIVQQLIEDLTGQPFVQAARERVLEPLGMSRSTFENPPPPALAVNTAVGHEGGGPIPGRFPNVAALAAGGLWTTAADYARLMIAARDAALGKPNPLLKPPIAEEMMRRQGGGQFGLGWVLVGEGAQRRFGHGGSNPGFQCENFLYAESGQGGVVMTNAESGLVFYWEVFNALAALHDWPGFMPAPKRVIPIPPEDFELYVGDYPIVSGVDAPRLRVFVEDGRLKSHIPGMRMGPRDLLLDQHGMLFSRGSPFETRLTFGEDSRLQELTTVLGGETEILKARR